MKTLWTSDLKDREVTTFLEIKKDPENYAKIESHNLKMRRQTLTKVSIVLICYIMMRLLIDLKDSSKNKLNSRKKQSNF
jgi:hypothetical protein